MKKYNNGLKDNDKDKDKNIEQLIVIKIFVITE